MIFCANNNVTRAQKKVSQIITNIAVISRGAQVPKIPGMTSTFFTFTSQIRVRLPAARRPLPLHNRAIPARGWFGRVRRTSRRLSNSHTLSPLWQLGDQLKWRYDYPYLELYGHNLTIDQSAGIFSDCTKMKDHTEWRVELSSFVKPERIILGSRNYDTCDNNNYHRSHNHYERRFANGFKELAYNV